jgi:hypothetical protein
MNTATTIPIMGAMPMPSPPIVRLLLRIADPNRPFVAELQVPVQVLLAAQS